MERGKRVNLVGLSLVAALVLVALVALIEKGPPPIYVFPAASTANLGPLGTYRLLQVLKERYEATPIFSLNGTRIPRSDVCVYAIISPTEPYTAEEAESVARMLRESCKRFSILVADELTTSNAVLKAVGSSIEVLGKTVRDAAGTPYPTAIVYVGNRSYTLRLDIASEVAGGGVAGYTTDHRITIASYERIGDNIVYVIGDGSIFLNQVLESNEAVYMDFVLDLFDHLCFSSSGCYIVIDNSNHIGVDIAQLGLSALPRLSPYDYIQLIPMLIARVLHPSFWLPPTVYILNRLTESALAVVALRIFMLLIAVSAVYALISKRLPRIRDTRLPEQIETEYYATADIRKAVIGGKVKLDRKDFVNLYEMFDSVLQSLKGVGLSDPKAANVLREVLGNRAEGFVKKMNRLYAKAMRRSLLPLVISWNRTVRKMIAECEDVLKALGTTLEAEKGVEYVLIRGLTRV